MIAITGVKGTYHARADKPRHIQWLARRVTGERIEGRDAVIRLACKALRARIKVTINGEDFPQL